MSTGSNSRHSFVDKISPLGESNSQSARTPQKDKAVSLSTGEKSTPPSFASSLAFLRDHKDEKSNDSADVKVAEDENQETLKPRHHHHHHHHHHKHKHHKRYVTPLHIEAIQNWSGFHSQIFFLFFLESKASNFRVNCQSSRPFARNINPYFLRKNKISSAAIVTGSLRVMVWLCSLIVRAAPCGNVSVSICRQRRPRSACASMQSDQGIHCPQTESLDTIECFNGEQMPNYSFDMAQLLLKSFEGRWFFLLDVTLGQSIAPDKTLFSAEKYWWFSYFSVKTYVVGIN